MSIDLVMYTHSSCDDVLEIFLSLFSKFVSNQDSCRFVVLTDNKQLTSENFKNNSKSNYILLEYDDRESYSNHFLGLQDVVTEYFLYMQEDFFIVSDWDYKELEKYVGLLISENLSLFRLTPSASYRSKAYLNRYLQKSLVRVPIGTFTRIDYLSALPACMQPTIWKSEIFLSMHKSVQLQNLRDEWADSYRSFFKNNGIVGLASLSVQIPYLEVTAVRKGRWNFTDYKWGLILQEILRAQDVNPLIRGIATYRFTVGERKSNLMKDIWRRIRYSS